MCSSKAWDVDPAGLTDAALLEHVEALHVAEARLRAAQAVALAALDAREVTVAECGRATRSWLSEELSLGRVDAGRRLLLARALPGLAVTAAALAAGELSAEHALVIAAGVRDLRGEQAAVVEAALVAAARQPGMTPQDLAGVLDGVREACGLNESRDEGARRRLAARRVTLDTTFGGCGSLSGTLTPDIAETLRLALTAAGQPGGAEDDRTAGQRAHDALGEIAAFFLSHGDTAAPETGERPRLVVTIGWAELQRDLAAAHDAALLAWGTFASGTAVSPATARRLGCDAAILPAVLGGRGEVLDLGRTSRTFSTAQRRAALVQQQHRCGFDRCRRPIRELHHLIWWSNGGPTSLTNAAWLCAFHHWLAHEGGWTVRRHFDGTLAWIRPDGQRHTQAA